MILTSILRLRAEIGAALFRARLRWRSLLSRARLRMFVSATGTHLGPGVRIVVAPGVRGEVILDQDVVLGRGASLRINGGTVAVGRRTRVDPRAELDSGGGGLFLGERVTVGVGVVLRAGGAVEIGDRAQLCDYATVTAAGGRPIRIGAQAEVGPHAAIVGGGAVPADAHVAPHAAVDGPIVTAPRERLPGNPEISVVISSRNRAAFLPGLLDALRHQTLPADRFEVVITDDGSEDDTAEILERAAREMPFALRVLRHRTPAGPAAGRNTAWRNATAPVVAFTDDDCLPTPAWLAAGLAAIRDGTDFLQGPTRPATRQLADLRGFATTLSVPSENVVYETSNMFYRREVLAALGGFDEAFRYPGGEDMDLGWRAREAGYRSSFAEDAVVEHAVHQRDLLGYLRSFWRFGDVARVLRIHPEARRWLPLRVFLDPEHAWFLLAVAGAVTGWLLSPWVFLACVPYGSMVVHDRAETTSLAIRVLRAPARVIATLGEIVMLLAASARHRSVLL